MSHVVSASVIITDLECLKRVLKRFPKIKFRDGQKTYKWWGKWENDYDATDAAYKNGIEVSDYGKCEHALHMDGVDYEVGVMKRRDGKGYSLVWDFFSDGARISEYIGNGAEKLMTAYNEEYTSTFSEQQGYSLSREEDDEFIYLEMNDYNS